jgi:predicted Zn-dependent protease
MLRWLSLFAVLLAGCTTNSLTGRSQFMVVSDRMAMSQSAAAYSEMMGELGKKKQIDADSERAKKVREITDKLVAQAVRFRPDSAGWKWEVQLINDDKTVNAFCMAGGKMAIYSGMWAKLEATDEEIAHVMGHEIGHALADHTRERMSIAYGSGIGTQVAAIALGAKDQTAALMQQAAVLAIQLPNSREGESEADQIGIELAARAGYDPKAAVTLWEKMGRLHGGKEPPEFLSTHPSPANRAARLAELGVKVEPLYRAAKAGAPQQAETLTFLAEPFERFKKGETVLDCRETCAYSYSARKGQWKRLHAAAAWRDLAVSVMQTGYLSDLSYFMLGEAAQGMELEDAAAAYYERALEANKRYACGTAASGCEGFDVRKLVQSRNISKQN